MLSLEQYLEIFNEEANNFMCIGFCKEIHTIVITHRDNTRVKFECTEHDYDLLRSLLPDTLQFMGFQHTTEGPNLSFWTYCLLDRLS